MAATAATAVLNSGTAPLQRLSQLATYALLLLLSFKSSHSGVTGPGAAGISGARVAVVNDIPGHFEVLAGVLATTKSLGMKPLALFTGNPAGPANNGLHDWVGRDVATWEHMPDSWPGSSADRKGSVDLLICVSAELAPKVCQAAVGVLAPRLVVVVVHRADLHTGNHKILRMHKDFRLMALAPHVAKLSSKRLGHRVDWAMPAAPFLPPVPCTTKACLKGFSIQGALRKFKNKKTSGMTRNYTRLWERMLQVQQQQEQGPQAGAGGAGGARPLRVIVVGKGFREDLAVPPELDGRVDFHARLRYPDFWRVIHGSYALVPAFGMPVYYESRISSTILASLITCVPVIAEQRLLDVYSFLGPQHVFLRNPDEDEVAAMVRIMAMAERDIFARRKALCDLQRSLNAASQQLLQGYLQALPGPSALKPRV